MVAHAFFAARKMTHKIRRAPAADSLNVALANSETMKPTSFRSRITQLLAALLLLPAFAQAHPGHTAADWFSAPPHAGHEIEYAILVTVLAVAALACGIHWLRSRKK